MNGMTRRTVCMAALLAIAGACAGAPAFAAADRDEATQAARRAFAESGRAPWYDAEKDVLQPVTVATPGDYDLDLDWVFKPLFWVGIAVIVVVLLVLAWWMVRMFADQNATVVDADGAGRVELAADWVEALPFMQERSRDDLLGQARRHYEAGNYAEAIIYLFSHELVELDRRALLALARGKTNRQYLREVARAPSEPIAGVLEQTMLAFEDVFFGGRTLDRARFELCWNQLPQFDQLVAQAQGAS
jgi:hypothetical protein